MTDNKPLSFAEETFQMADNKPKKLTPSDQDREKRRCADDLVYFINTYVQIYDNLSAAWVPFTLWPAQIELLRAIEGSKYALIPKARQIGITWLLGDARPLWKMIFHPIREVLIFSQRDDEAMKLLERLKGTFERLPDWMKPGIDTNAAHEFSLKNGSRVQALPSTAGGRSNAATDVIVDEADYVTNLKGLITAAKPTIDAGTNQMVVLSTINEETPNSYFQRLCKANQEGDQGWVLHFLGWQSNPNRTLQWYEDQKQACLVDNGTLDPLYKEYPATLAEALAPRELNKRFPPDWLVALSAARKPVPVHGEMPATPGLKIFKVPQAGKTYGIGADPGGGKLDPSVAQVIDGETKEQVAVLAGLVEPTQFANQVADLSLYYNGAPVLFELNNHGHAFLAQAKERGTTLRRGVGRRGKTDNDPGWLTTERSKHMLYDVGAKVMQELIAMATLVNGVPEAILCEATTIAELASIEISTLEAPEGLHDDHAMAWVLAQMCLYKGTASMSQVSYTGLWHKRNAKEADEYTGPGAEPALPDRKLPQPIAPRVQPKPEPRRDDAVPPHIMEKYGRYRR